MIWNPLQQGSESSRDPRPIRVGEKTMLEESWFSCYPDCMKMTFAIPDEVGRRFRRVVPPQDRSAVVANLLRRKLRLSRSSAEAVCRRVNQLDALEDEMARWEQFDDQPA